ncbi:pyrimidodiazepine synthase-like [Anthonomus grandis grandis]|uniref:pyrimidodiazepine synthase-like n=1 Tax=Anthonomus grandis grandis TaxID=2921223 RepID=UPI00216523F5|nr:pyrimidodiazepine synthase-like [Anthonomus grandis grandis]
MNSPHLARGSRQPSPPPKGKLRLYSNRFCPYAQRVMLVLDAKKIAYDVVNIKLYSKPEWFYDVCPSGRIPALELETGDVLYDSLVIADYLDEKYRAHHLHSQDPLQKAKDKLLIEEFSRIVNATSRCIQSIGRGLDSDDVIVNGLARFEHELANNRGTPFFGGVKPGMLDLMIWPWCERAEILKFFGSVNLLNKDKYKKLMEWSRRMSEEPSVKRSMMDSDTHIKYLQSYRAGRPDYDMILNSTN